MKIAESNIHLASSHPAVEYSERRESLVVWRQGRESVRAEKKNSQDDALQKQAGKLAKFAELAAHDGDGNGWVDENDDIYSQLRIWTQTAAGEDQLLALEAKGVGAMYLGRVEAPFSVKDGNNELQGQVRATGLFLFEQGGAGTMQPLDLVA